MAKYSLLKNSRNYWTKQKIPNNVTIKCIYWRYLVKNTKFNSRLNIFLYIYGRVPHLELQSSIDQVVSFLEEYKNS